MELWWHCNIHVLVNHHLKMMLQVWYISNAYLDNSNAWNTIVFGHFDVIVMLMILDIVSYSSCQFVFDHFTELSHFVQTRPRMLFVGESDDNGVGRQGSDEESVLGGGQQHAGLGRTQAGEHLPEHRQLQQNLRTRRPQNPDDSLDVLLLLGEVLRLGQKVAVEVEDGRRVDLVATGQHRESLGPAGHCWWPWLAVFFAENHFNRS